MTWWPYWPWSEGDQDEDDAEPFPTRPVILFPGICGSILHIREVENPSSEHRVWVTITWADYNFR